mmetsp:Transcript_11046/g.23609  ORF Transcript_11046/g.23609 Transcript_11046/m.23609 type:complete len:617 (-) Transcript_11046:47-1897(-)
MRTSLIAAAALAGVASGFVARTGQRPPPNAAQSRSRSDQRTHDVVQSIQNRSPSSQLRESSTETNGSSSSKQVPSDWQSQILSALSVIIDPDLNSDIVSLGFVQNLRLDESSSIVSLDLELTTPACPVKDLFVQQCKDIINGLPFTRGAEVTLTAQENTAPLADGTPLGMSQIGAVIAVSSCKGGVGKSTTAVNLAYSLKALGARVGIFDADVYGPSLPTMVTPDDDNVRFVGRQIAPLQREDVRLMSFGYVNEGSAIMRGPMVTQLLDQFLSLTNWGPIDYLIMDMPPGTGDIQLTLSQRLNITAAVIVTTPQELSFVDVERGVEMFDTVNVPCVAVVENMAYLEKDAEDSKSTPTIDEMALTKQFVEALKKDGMVGDSFEAADVASNLVNIVKDNLAAQSANLEAQNEKEQVRIFGPGHKRRLSEQWGIEHTYSIPLMGQIAQNGDSGTPFVLDNPNSPQAEIYGQLAKSVVSEVAKVKFGKGRGGGRPEVTYDSDTHTIRVVEPSGLGAADDEEELLSTISTAELRRECRCAACVEELTGKQILDPKSIPETISPLSMSPTGNYALSVDWSDGHRSLYPYRQIRSLLEDAKEKKKEEEDVGAVVEETKEKAVL